MAKRLRPIYKSLLELYETSGHGDELVLLRQLFERNEWPMVEPEPEPEAQVQAVPEAEIVSDTCQCVAETLHGTQTVNISLGDSGKMLELSFNWVIRQ